MKVGAPREDLKHEHKFFMKSEITRPTLHHSH